MTVVCALESNKTNKQVNREGGGGREGKTWRMASWDALCSAFVSHPSKRNTKKTTTTTKEKEKKPTLLLLQSLINERDTGIMSVPATAVSLSLRECVCVCARECVYTCVCVCIIVNETGFG